MMPLLVQPSNRAFHPVNPTVLKDYAGVISAADKRVAEIAVAAALPPDRRVTIW